MRCGAVGYFLDYLHQILRCFNLQNLLKSDDDIPGHPSKLLLWFLIDQSKIKKLF